MRSSGVEMPSRSVVSPATTVIEAVDRGEETGTRALRRRIDRALDRILDVGRGKLAPVVELHALAQRERIGQAVVGDRVALGEIGHEIRRAGLVVHQPVENALDDRPVLPVVADRRIERRYVVLVGDDHLAALFGSGADTVSGSATSIATAATKTVLRMVFSRRPSPERGLSAISAKPDARVNRRRRSDRPAGCRARCRRPPPG